MNDIFLNKLEEQEEAITKLLKVDNDVLGTNYTLNDVLNMINDLRNSNYENIHIQENSLILSDASLFEFLRLFTYIDTDVNFLLFPNYIHLGMISLFRTIFNLSYAEHCYISNEKNYDKYYPMKKNFGGVYVYGEKIVFDAIAKDFKDAIWIDSEK